MTDKTLKRTLFSILFLFKLMFIITIFYLKSTSNILESHAISIISIIAPLFTVSLTIMFKDIIKNNNHTNNNHFDLYQAILCILIVLIYALAIIFVVYGKIVGFFNYEEMKIWIAVVESILGGYLGIIVNFLFGESRST